MLLCLVQFMKQSLFKLENFTGMGTKLKNQRLCTIIGGGWEGLISVISVVSRAVFTALLFKWEKNLR